MIFRLIDTISCYFLLLPAHNEPRRTNVWSEPHFGQCAAAGQPGRFTNHRLGFVQPRRKEKHTMRKFIIRSLFAAAVSAVASTVAACGGNTSSPASTVTITQTQPASSAPAWATRAPSLKTSV